jgi:hypothetical protein
MNNQILCAFDTWNINHWLLQNNLGFQILVKISVVKLMNLTLNNKIKTRPNYWKNISYKKQPTMGILQRYSQEEKS